MDIFQETQAMIVEAATDLKIAPGHIAILQEPQKVITINLAVTMDDGVTRSFIGYRSQHNNALGPYKGGIRYHQQVGLEEVKALSMWMTLKCSILGLPYGGGKGGIACNPKEMSDRELERLSRSYIRALADEIGPEKDIPAPDVNTNPQVMAWMADEFSRLKGQNAFSVVTGKPLIIGGSQGRVAATGRGCLYAIEAAAAKLNLDLKDCTFIVQGLGNVGSTTVKLLAKKGAKLVGAADSRGGVYNATGLNIQELMRYKETYGSVAGFPGGDQLASQDILLQTCDLLIPAALENQLTAANAHLVQARLVAEAANGPTTREANAILHQRGVFIIPDVLANAGGAVVSYFEWVQDLHSYYWSEHEVNERLRDKMFAAFENVYALSYERGIDMRKAAYLLGIKRVAEAMTARGWV